jgi:hypothetical protein
MPLAKIGQQDFTATVAVARADDSSDTQTPGEQDVVEPEKAGHDPENAERRLDAARDGLAHVLDFGSRRGAILGVRRR